MQKKFLQFIGTLFLAKVIVFLLFWPLGWGATVAGWQLPTWLYVIAVIVDLWISWMAFRLAKRSQ
jgi:hypothetical protein